MKLKNIIAVTRSQQTTVLLLIIILSLIAFFYSPTFLRLDNIFSILQQASVIGILAIGMAIVLIGAGVDLSVVATLQAAIAIFAAVSKGGGTWDLCLATVIVIGAGLMIGAVNGVVVTRFRIQPLLATLFIGSIVTGLRLVFTQESPSGSAPAFIRFLGQHTTGPVPHSVLIFLLIAAIVHIVFKYTVYGRSLVAVGFNLKAANLSGINTSRTTILSYCCSGVLAAVSGMLLWGYVGYADQWIGGGYELRALAAAIVGGNLFGGGRGSITGAVLGALLVVVATNLVLLLRLDMPYQLLARGLILIIAALFGTYVVRKSY